MKRKKRSIRQFLSLFLVMIMCFTTVVPVQAAEIPVETEVQTEETVLTEIETEEILTGTGEIQETEESQSIETEDVQESEDIMPLAEERSIPTTIAEGEVYELTEDITLASGEWFEEIAGTLDGKGHTITLTDKPLANNVSGTIQNLGVKGDAVSDANLGSMAVNLTGTIQNCYSVAKVECTDMFLEPGGLVGDLTGGSIKNSYFAGNVVTLFDMYGGISGASSGQSQIANTIFTGGSYTGPVSIVNPKPEYIGVVEKKSLDEIKTSIDLLNTDITDTGFVWTSPVDGSNNGLPVLKEGTVSAEVDKTALQNLVNEVKAMDESAYTEASWNVLMEALAAAQAVLDDADATKTDVDSAISALQTAKAELEKAKITTPVAPPEDENQIKHITSQDDLEAIGYGDTSAYYILDNDITVSGWYMGANEFKGVLDGNGHTITFDSPAIVSEIFITLAPGAVMQNIYFKGTTGSDGAVGGPACRNLQGSIINCYSEISGDYACGFAKRIDGGIISNCYSVSTGKQGVLFKEYKSGTLMNTYWQEFLVNNISFPADALINSSEKSEDEMKTKEFIALLNANRGDYGVKWGQNSDGYPYFGEDQAYNPDKPDFPENKYTVTFTAHNGDVQTLDSQIFALSPDDVGASNIAGNFGLLDVPEDSSVEWSLSQIKPEGSMMIGADGGDLRIDAEGSAVVTATEIKADGTSETAASVKVLAKAQVMEEIKLFIDGEDVTGGKVEVQGSEWKDIQVQARYAGEDNFLPVSAGRFTYAASDESFIDNYSGVTSSFKFLKPGTASITVTSKTDASAKAEVEITSLYVPVEKITPGISGVREIHGRNANSIGTLEYNPEKLGVSVEPANASFAGNYTVESSDPTIGEFLVDQYIPFRAGTVTYTATLKDTNPETKVTNTVTGASTVTYVYTNPLTRVTAEETSVEMENFTEKDLKFNFEGERSDEGYTVTDPELIWTYDKEGIVKISRRGMGYWKKDTPDAEGTPDYTLYFASKDYYVTALKEGTVVATGTPADKTNKVDPVTVTITVKPGEMPEVDIDALVEKGTESAVSYLKNKYSGGYTYNNNDWAVYALLKMGESIEQEQLDAYYASVAETVKGWKNTQKPTDIERVMLVLSIMDKDITNVGGVNLAEMIYNHPNLDMGGNELAWALLALDAKNTEIPEDAKWSREAMIEALLGFQNPATGGFGLYDNESSSVDITAMALQALAKYKNTDIAINRAIENGLTFLENSMGDAYDYGTAESISQVLLTLVTLGINPLDSDFGQPYSNTITALMDNYFCETDGGNGFSHDKSAKKINDMATVQALQAFTAYVMYKNDEGFYWDLSGTETVVTSEELIEMIDKLPDVKTLTLKDEAVVKHLEEIYQSLSDEEKALVENYDILEKALEQIENLHALGEEVGSISVTVMDGIKESDVKKLLPDVRSNAKVGEFLTELQGADSTEIRGTMVQMELPIYEKDSMMSAIVRACEQNHLDISVRGGTYIESIDGLSEFDRGPGSGWVGTLNNGFPQTSFADFTVENGLLKNGDVVTVEYTHNLGKDVTDNAELETLGLSSGKIAPEFKRDVYGYTITVDDNISEIRLNPTAYNRYSMIEITSDDTAYGKNEAIPVKNGTEIKVVSTKAVRGVDTKTYTLTIKKNESVTPDPDPTPDPDTVTLVDKKYGVSLKGEGLDSEMELVITPLGKDDSDVTLMRKAITSDKSIFRLYNIKLMKDGKEIALPKKSVLSIPVGDKYNDKEMTALYCKDSKVEQLKGKVRNGVLEVEVESLGSFGVVIETPNGQNNGNGSGNAGTGNSGISGTTQKGAAVKTGNDKPIAIMLVLLVASAVSIGIIFSKKRKQNK